MHAMTESRAGLRRLSLRWHLNVAFAIIGALLLAGALVQGALSQRLLESRYWATLLGSSLDSHLAQGGAADRGLPQSGLLRIWRVPARAGEAALPPGIAALQPGFRQEQVEIGDREYMMLVRDVGRERYYVAQDITELEHDQNLSVLYGLSFVALGLVLIALALHWLARHLSTPVRDLAERMIRLEPGTPNARLPSDYRESEIATIAAAANAHLDRVESFIERERALLDQASHEFRTPISVIAGAAEVLRALPDMPAAAERPLLRIERTIANLNEVMVALLYLARERRSGAAIEESCALDRFLPELVGDHQHLLRGKQVEIGLSLPPNLCVAAPEAMLRIAIGNLLRNAAENTVAGRIEVSIPADATVLQIVDTGIGVDAAVVAAHFNRSLRATPETEVSRGLGLFLVHRICERFGWTLRIEALAQGGTRASLDFGAGLDTLAAD
ncbi:sensor histidine kinase [Lysobacter sp. CA196]|uniref:sensor histidine kinase n=1 Tax=Lysobacter sp. CA196 TaxID=3455606 RepID=UPI003F8D3FF1